MTGEVQGRNGKAGESAETGGAGVFLPARNRLSEAEIRAHLPEGLPPLRIELFEEIDSTNSHAKRLLREAEQKEAGGTGAPGHTLIAANTQTAGRGRFARRFFSPPDTGIYMTLVLPFAKSAGDALPMTMASAVSVTELIARHTGRRPGIKWVNDIYLDGRKVCGILTEFWKPQRPGGGGALIVGVGLNTEMPQGGFPEELKEKAGALSGALPGRSQLIAELAARLIGWSGRLSSPELIEAYRENSLILGREISWKERNHVLFGRAVEISETGALLVETEEGVKTLCSGEVSVRFLETEENRGTNAD